jgi:hypothetical protein
MDMLFFSFNDPLPPSQFSFYPPWQAIAPQSFLYISLETASKDRFHQVVKTALATDGWNVTHDPLQIKVGGVDMEIDLGAERLLAAERGDEKIAVEVKSFLASASAISEFHTALGQFINYRAALRREEPIAFSI